MVLKPQDQESFPKLKKTSRSFKEIAEVAIGQIEFLLSHGYFNTNLGTAGETKFLQS